jgi:NAD(P)-dependent dehydrogenase (short-subunit alcohol dehydrogenase family)
VGEVVVVTGASAGVGRAVVRLLARRGASLGLIARGRDALRATAAEVEALGGRALPLPCDVSDEVSVEAAAERVERELGPIDAWINNAMVSVFAPVTEIGADDFRRVTEVTYLGTVFGTMSALRRMKPRDRGVIVQVGSLLARRSIPLQSAYCGAKHATLGFSESLRCELIHDGSRVRLTMVELPAVNTPQFDWAKTTLPRAPRPMGTVYQPEVAARAVVHALDHPRRDFVVGGAQLLPHIAQKLVPAVLDHVIAERGYEGQQGDARTSPHRRDNLWEPLPGDAGAHGAFDRESKATSLQAWASRHRLGLGVALVSLLTALGLFRRRGRRGRRSSRRAPAPRAA